MNKKEMDQAKRNYIELRKENMANYRKLEQRNRDLLGNIAGRKKELEENLVEQQRTRDRIAVLEELKKWVETKAKEDLEAIYKHPGTKRAYIANTDMFIITQPVTCLDPKTETKRNLGSFKIQIGSSVKCIEISTDREFLNKFLISQIEIAAKMEIYSVFTAIMEKLQSPKINDLAQLPALTAYPLAE